MFVYIDESGHPHPNDPCERPVNVAVCLKREDVRRLTATLFRFMGDFKLANPGWRPRKAEREGKAVEFLTKRALLRQPAKREYSDSVMDLIADLDVTVFAMVMERPDRPIYGGVDLLQNYHRWMLERIQAWMETHHPERLATIVFDGRERKENVRLDSCFTRFLFRSAQGKAMTHIVPNVLYVDSELTPGIKLADFCAYILRVYYENGLDRTDPRGNPYLSIMNRYQNIVRRKSYDFVDDDGQKNWGIRTMTKEHFAYDPPK